MIAILVAVKQELNPILRLAQADQVVRQAHLDFHEGMLGGQPVALLALGIGKECARIAAEMTIRCYRPDLIISAGFGGGLTDRVEDGDIVLGTEILELEADLGNGIRFRSTHKLPHLHGLENAGNGRFRVHQGKLITADEMVLRATHKIRIGQMTGALAVDMETSAVAAVCAVQDTDFLAVRAISDNSHENLPTDFNDFFVLGQLQRRRVLSSCLRSPRLLYDLGKLGHRAHTAGRNLAAFLELNLPRLHLPALAARNLQ